MTILQKILDWSQGIPTWQSDAVARLLAKQELTMEDYDDLLALLKLVNGIPDPKNRQPQPLTVDQIPAPIKVNTQVELHAMKNLDHVNAIASNQRMPFGPAGMTVIYGDNGSGKSGYSRVLKRACRARDQMEAIHPNANLPVHEVGIPAATFEITVNGVQKDVVWAQGKSAPVELSSFAIFDTRCARAYIDSEDDFAYVPYGLDVFERLVKVCQRLKVMVEEEFKQSTVDVTVFAHLHGDTTVGKLVAALSAKTNLAEIEALATLTQEDLIQHEMQSRSLKENNPKEKAGQLRLCARRVATISTSIVAKTEWVTDEAVAVLKGLSESYRGAQQAASLAAQKFKEGADLLTGTGGPVWQDLFEAARKFAVESHPHKTFPDLGKDSPCPLCQQPLGEGAARLLRFEEFVQDETEKTVKERRRALYAVYKPLVEHDLTLSIDEVTFGEISALDAQLATNVKSFEAVLVARQEIIKSAVISHDWSAVDQMAISPAESLQALVKKLNDEAQALELASDEKARAELQKLFNELDARVRLHQSKDALVKAVKKLNHQAKLKGCLPALRTQSISIKASELTELVVSKELADTLNLEFKTLGVGMLQVSLQSRVERGRALHKLKLELPQRRSPAEILSEGEQRAIAIGSFLAEVGLSDGRGGIVFDDPVSSLDHRRRERVAKRLALEAAKRQVIIFTHDIYFLCVLAEEAKLAGVPILTQSITRRSEGFGISDPELPFEGRNVGKRIGALKAQHQVIAKLYKDGEEQEHFRQTIDCYFRLRMTWERAVEEILLREVVIRFRKGVETQRLAGVSVDDDDYANVYEGMTKCSNYAHDKALFGGIAIPDPDELLADIVALETWRTRVQKRGDEIQKIRKAGPVLAPVAAV